MATGRFTTTTLGGMVCRGRLGAISYRFFFHQRLGSNERDRQTMQCCPLGHYRHSSSP